MSTRPITKLPRLQRIPILLLSLTCLSILVPAGFAWAQQGQEQIKQSLDQQAKSLEKEWEAIQAETEELNKIAKGPTLRGSRANEYKKRVSELEARKAKYMQDKQELEADYKLLEDAQKQMKQGSEAAGTAAAANDPSEVQRLAAEFEQRRKALSDEYRSLQSERAKIGAQGKSKTGAPSVAEEMAEWKSRMDEHAKRRREFNDAVRSFNQSTGQNLKTLAPL